MTSFAFSRKAARRTFAVTTGEVRFSEITACLMGVSSVTPYRSTSPDRRLKRQDTPPSRVGARLARRREYPLPASAFAVGACRLGARFP